MYPCLDPFLKYMAQICLERCYLFLQAVSQHGLGKQRMSVKGGVMTMTHLTVWWLLNKAVPLPVELTFHTSAAPTREQGCEQSALGWVPRSSSREVAMRVGVFLFCFFSLFFFEHRFPKSASPPCILTLKWGVCYICKGKRLGERWTVEVYL